MPTSPEHVLPAIVAASGLGALVMCLLVLRYGFATPPEERGEGRRRELTVRLGHAVAGVCFAAAAILSVVLMTHAQRAPGAAPPGATRDDDGLERVVDARVAGVTERLVALESRVDAMEALVAPLDGRVAETRDRLGVVAARLERAAAPLERRVRDVEARLRPLESVVRQQTDDLGRATARLRQLEDQQASVPARPVPPSPTPPEKRLRAKDPPPVPPPAPPEAPRPAPPATGAASGSAPARPNTPGEQLGDRIRDDWQTVKRGFSDAGEDLRSAVESLRRNLRDTVGR